MLTILTAPDTNTQWHYPTRRMAFSDNRTLLSPMPLSSVDMAEIEHVRESMRLLKRLMAGEPAPTTPIMVPPSRIVERESTDVVLDSRRATPDAR